MPEQILLQSKILGTEEFLLAGSAEGRSARAAGEDLLAGRSQWITLICEVLPRALLAELGLARIRLLTNNPEKVTSLEACGVEVVERIPHEFAPNGVNDGYLATKARRFGHLLG